MEAWAACHGVPTIIATASGRVVWSNRAAEAFAEAQDDLSLDDGELSFADRRTAASFREHCGAMKDETPSAWLYRPRGEDAVYLVRCQRIAPDGAEPAMALQIFHTERNTHVWADLKEAFGLTPAEERIVRRMIEGENVEGLAVSLAISVETARTHVRRVYAKLGINGREQLFKKVAGYRAY